MLDLQQLQVFSLSYDSIDVTTLLCYSFFNCSVTDVSFECRYGLAQTQMMTQTQP